MEGRRVPGRSACVSMRCARRAASWAGRRWSCLVCSDIYKSGPVGGIDANNCTVTVLIASSIFRGMNAATSALVNDVERLPPPVLPDRATIESAAQTLRMLVPPTPQYDWPQVSAAFGTEVWVKHENHTPIAAFKARSAAMYFDKLLKRAPDVRGVITATRGNHGQAVALAARRYE